MRRRFWLAWALTAAAPVWAQTAASTSQAPGPPAGDAAAAPTQTAPATPAAAPEHPITAEQVHEMMELTGTLRLQKQMLDGMMPALRRTMPAYVPADVMDDFENSVLGPEMDAAIVKTYQEHLSTEDAAATIAFYRTPAGQHALAAMPAILRDLQTAGAQIGMQVMEEVMERHKAEINDAKQKYEMMHPWSAPKN